MRLKTLSFPIAGMLALAASASAQVVTRFDVGTSKQYRQFGGSQVDFRTGDFHANLKDGIVIYRVNCDSPFFFNPTLGCPLGATGYVNVGEGLGPYFSASTVMSSQLYEPFRPDKIKLLSAPASTLPRPQTGFEDRSLSVYYNLQSNGNFRDYYITLYDYSKPYNSRKAIESDIVPGVYNFSFPKKGAPDQPVSLPVTIRSNVEGYAKVSNKKLGVRFTGVNFDSDGFALFDIAGPNVLRWEGITNSLVTSGTDKLYISIQDFVSSGDSDGDTVETVTVPDPILGTTTTYNAARFPAFLISGEIPRITLSNPFVNTYTFPPASYPVPLNDGTTNTEPLFVPGGEYVIRLTLERNYPTNALSYDVSRRYFELPIRISKSFATYVAANFTDKKKKKSSGGLDQDYDGDGVTNVTEWALGSSATSSASKPAPRVLPIPVYNQLFPVFYTATSRKGFAGTIPAVSGAFTAEISTNSGANWTPLVTDATWNVNLNDEVMTVSSKAAITTDMSTTRIRLVPPTVVTH